MTEGETYVCPKEKLGEIIGYTVVYVLRSVVTGEKFVGHSVSSGDVKRE